MNNLKEVVFFRANAEAEAYLEMKDGYTEEEKERQKERFMSIYQTIKEAGLEDEYQAWKEDHQDWREL